MAELLPTAGRWREVASASSIWLPPRIATLAVATVLPAMVQVHWLGLTWGATFVVGACLAVIAVVGPDRLVASAAAAVVVGLVVSPKLGPIAALVVLSLAVGWLLVAGRVLPTAPRSIPPMALGPLAVASALLSLRSGLVLPAALIVLGFVLTAIERAAPAGSGRFVRIVDAGTAHLARWVAVIAMLPVAAVIVLVWIPPPARSFRSASQPGRMERARIGGRATGSALRL